MKEKILFKCYSGSKLYDTNNENSDTDIKGVFLPELNDLLLGKAPKHYQFTTNKEGKNTKEDIDECYYSLHYFFELLSKGDTNALDLFFANTNKESVIIETEEWKEIIKNQDRLITNNMKSYLGFCKSQSIKYSFKGEKLTNFKKLRDFLYNKNIYEWMSGSNDYTLKCTLNFAIGGDFTNMLINKFIPKVDEEKIKFTEIDFGNQCYIETAKNKESYLTIYGIKFQLNEFSKNVFEKLNDIICSYGERTKEASNGNGIDYKAISHAIRVSLQTEELLTKNYITFPLRDKEFIKMIKYNTTPMNYDEIMDWLEKKIGYIEKELIPKSKLRDKSDFEWINNFILKQYLKQKD